MDSSVVRAKPSKNTKPEIERALEIACKRLSGAALRVIEKIMMDDKADPKVRMDACKEIFNRGFGRPKQTAETVNINLSGGEDLITAITQARNRVIEAIPDEKDVISIQ